MRALNWPRINNWSSTKAFGTDYILRHLLSRCAILLICIVFSVSLSYRKIGEEDSVYAASNFSADTLPCASGEEESTPLVNAPDEQDAGHSPDVGVLVRSYGRSSPPVVAVLGES